MTARGTALIATLAALLLATPAAAQDADSATYTVTFQGNWTTASTPGGVVSSAHFTTLIGAVHNDMVTFWESGGMATAGVEGVAELGATSTFRSEINAEINDSDALSVISKSVSFGGTGSATFDVTVTEDHPLVTLLSMIGPSPDWFVGISGRSLLDDQDEWRSRLQIDLFPYDAGTEEGTEFSLNNAATSPQEAISSIKGMGKFSDVRMARLTFVLQTPAVVEATVSVEGGSAAEGSPVEFTVGLSEEVGSDVVLGWTTGDDAAPDARQATSGVDYTAQTSGSVTITAGATEATFQVATTQDTTPEGDETFAVTVTGSTLPDGVAIETAGATGTIVDDDELAVSVTGGSAAEGSPVGFRVSLPAMVGSDVVLSWTTGDDTAPDARQATSGVDYTAQTSGSVTITAGATEATFQVATTQDAAPEGDETFVVAVEASTLPPGVMLPANSSAVGTIVDDDAVTVSLDGGSALEGAPVEFTVRLSESVGSDVVLGWMTGNDATPNARPAMAGTDYAETTDGQVTVAANATSATFEVLTLADDARVEGDETFAVTVTGDNLPGGVVVPAGTRAIGTIRDEDRALVSVVAGPAAAEGEGVTFTMRLSERVFPEDVVLFWSTIDDTTPNATPATANEDYTAETDGRVTVPANESSATLMVPTRADDLEEDPETFAVTVTASSLLEKTVVPPDTLAVGTIREADPDDGGGGGGGGGRSVRLSVTAEEAPEGEPVVFTVRLSRSVGSPVPLAWSIVDGSAAAGEDYPAFGAQTVTIPAGATSAVFELPTIDDVVVEEPETVTVAVTAAGPLPSGVRRPSGVRATGTIMDDDEAAVTVTAADPAPEGAAVTFTLSLSAPVSSVVPLTWSTTGGTATAGDDYAAVTAQSAMIAPREMNAVFMVNTIDDAVVERDETVTVAVAAGALPRGVTVAPGLGATGTIADNDGLTVALVAGAAPEGEALGFTVSLPAPFTEVVPLTWSTVGGTATAGEDYAPITDRPVTIPAGRTGVTFAVRTMDDALVEVDETVVVAVEAAGAPPLGVRVPADLRAAARIEDDESRASGFTDDPVVAGLTVVRAVHLEELRERIDALRIEHGLERFAYRDPSIEAGVTPVRAVHVAELRTALDGVYDAAERRRPTYGDEPREGAELRAAHVNDLRRAIQALE